MSLKRYAAKRDATEPAIRQALTQVGAQSLRLDAVDLLVLFRGQLYLLECKTEHGRATRTQDGLRDVGWPVHVVRNADDALRAIGAIKPGTRPATYLRAGPAWR